MLHRASLPTAAAAISVCLFAAPSALAQRGAVNEPIIRIEMGVHSAPVKSIRFDRDCRLAVTGSDDKTTRIWSRAVGGAPVLQRTLRWPIGLGDLGKVYAVEISPDGALAAVAGWSLVDPHIIMLFEVATGRVVTQLGPLANVTNRLAFSADGRYLAAALGAGNGIRVFEQQAAAEWRDALKDEDFGGRDAYGVTFGPDGRLYAVGDDASVRRYSRAFKREVKVKTEGGKEPYSIAVHPEGRIVAVGYDDTQGVELLDADKLQRVHTVDTAAVTTGNVSSVVWSRDGHTLWAGGTFSKDGQRVLLSWADRGRGPGVLHASEARDSIRDLSVCGDSIGLATSDPGIGLVDGRGKHTAWIGSAQVDMRRKLGREFMVSRNGQQVRFGLGRRGQMPVLFDLAAQQLRDAPEADALLLAARTEGLDIKDWEDSRQPRLGGKPIALKEYEDARSLAIASDASGFVLGTSWYIRSFSAQGKEQWARPLTGSGWGVVLTAQDRVLIAALGDGTIRWLRMSDGQELLVLFVNAHDRRWVAWTPKGYYMASDKGDELIGWHQNRGDRSAAEFAFASERRETHRRPDVVRRTIELADEDRAITELIRR